jgi:hypothetical protein
MYSLCDDLFEEFGEELRRTLTYGFGVVTPDAHLPDTTPEWDESELLDAGGFRADEDLQHFLFELAEFYNAKKGSGPKTLSKEWIWRIGDFLRPRFDRVPSILKNISEVNEATESLTKKQYEYLDVAEGNARVLCRGGAGTGKTFLALEVARREAADGRSVLLTCRNPALSRFLKARLESEGGIEVRPAGRLGDGGGETYDCLVVDEGQDLLTMPHLSVLDGLLDGGFDEGRWRFFYDPNRQSGFYGDEERSAVNIIHQANPASIDLPRNCRNPRPIVKKTRVYTGGDLGKPAAGEGPDVHVAYPKDNVDAKGRLQMRLQKLFGNDVEPQSISILSPRPFEESSAAELTEGFRKKIKPLDPSTAGDFPFSVMSFSSIRDFKGFENDVVIVTDLAPEHMKPSAENVLYVAMSRARVQLDLLLRKSLEAKMEKLISRHANALAESEG